MHQWLQSFSAYISQQISNSQNALQTALILIQAFLDQYPQLNSIEKTCEYLSKFPFKTINDLLSSNVNSTVDIMPNHDVNNKKVILVAYLTEDASSKTGEFLLKDTSASIPASFINIDSKDLHIPLFIIHSTFIVESRKLMFESQQGKNIYKYVELHSWVKKGTDKSEVDENTRQMDILSVSLYTQLAIKPKYVNIKGIIINKSPIHKIRGHNPFFFINLQCSDNPSVVVPVVIQGCTHVHWYSFVKLFQNVLINKLKLTVVSKGKKDEKQVRCTSNGSTYEVLSLESNGDIFENSMNIFSNIGPSDGTINYMGHITDNRFAEFGLYILDERVKLLISHQPQLHLGKGYRVGAQIHAVDVHPINHKNELVLCCCTKSCIEVIELSSQETPYIPFLAQSNPFSSCCQKISVDQYLLMVEVVSEIQALLPAHTELSHNEWSKLQTILQTYITPITERPTVFSEFIDEPHTCIFTLPTNRNERVPLPQLWGVRELSDHYEQMAQSEEFQGNWLTGNEYDRFQYDNPTNWMYSVIEPKSSQQKFLCGCINVSSGHLKLTDATGSILIVISGDTQDLTDKVVLVEKYKIIVEKSCYEELIKQTGRTREETLYRIYVMCTRKDLNVLSLTDMPRENLLANGKRSCGDILEEPASKQICATKSDNRSTTTSALIVARQFKRQRVGYDVEVHSEDQIFVPGLGRVRSSEIRVNCISLFPFTTSNLVFRLQDVDTKKMTALYIDANNLPYNFAFLPGAIIRLTNVIALTSRNGSTYYKLKKNSTMELLELPPPFAGLQNIMNEVEENMKNCTKRKYLIDFLRDSFQKEEKNDFRSDVFRCVARISLVLNVTAKWVCGRCMKEMGEKGRCTLGCKQKRSFHLEARCCVDDGTAEAYIFVEEPNTSKMLSLSHHEMEFLRSNTFRCGPISYNKNTTGTEMMDNMENNSKRRQCECILIKHSNDLKISRMLELFLKPFHQKEVESGFPSCTFTSGRKEYHSLTYRKLTYKCVTFQTVNYRHLLKKGLEEEEKLKFNRNLGEV